MKIILLIVIIFTGFFVETISCYSQFEGDRELFFSCDTFFYDKGGLNGNYGNNENYTVSFCSPEDQVMSVIFEYIHLEDDNDKLLIFDGGEITDFPVAELDKSKRRYVFTSLSSCMTFHFISDSSGTNAGWKAHIFCKKTLQPKTRNISVNINPPYDNADYLVQDVLVTGCLKAWNVKYTGGNNQKGYFNGNACPVLGINEGVVLATGRVDSIITGPNEDGSMSDESGTPGDPLLDQILDSIVGYDSEVYNASVLEFDFRPESNKLQFKYVFASEEYPEFNCSSFNDIFGFFITGPNPGGGSYNNKNIALIPGKNVPVAINSINTGNTDESFEDGSLCSSMDPDWQNNAIYYKSNENGNDLQFDGLTVPLVAEVDVEACKTYHIKLAIADASDEAYDSAVFLEANSFQSGEGVEIIFEDIGGGKDTYEGCPLYLSFTRSDSSKINTPYTVNYKIGGTATPNIDYQALPASVIIPAGQMNISYNLATYSDALSEGSETVIVQLDNSQACPCQGLLSDSVTVNINDSPLKATFDNVADICKDSSATLTVNIIPSKSPYSYSWSNGVTFAGNNLQHSITVTPVAGALPFPVTYYVTVSDACGNTSVDDVTFNVIDCGSINLNLTANPNQICINACTDISAVVGGNFTEPYIVVWDNGLQNGTGPHPVCPTTTTTYSATVTDQEGHTATSSLTVTVNPLPVISFSVTNTSCSGFCDGLANAVILSGKPPYTYFWSDNQTINPAKNLCAGSISVTVSDANGCNNSASVTVSEPPVLTSTINGLNSLCFGSSLGYANITPSGGTPPYKYLWSNNDHDSLNNNIPAGIYIVTVTDANKCTTINQITIAESYPITLQFTQTNLTCFNTMEGSASVNQSGGTGPYKYHWSNNGNTSTISNIGAGTYTVTLTDLNNCTATGSVTITQPLELTVEIPEVNKICISQSATLTVNASGGTPVYSYLWNDQSIGTTLTVSPKFNTTYYVIITDANGCTVKAIQTVEVYDPLKIKIYAPDTLFCPGECITINVELSGGNGGPYQLILQDGSAVKKSFTVCPTATTTYTITAGDACTLPEVTSGVTLYALPEPPVDFISDSVEGCVPLIIQFHEISQYHGLTYFWNFNDPYGNNYSTEKNPKHKFNTAGTYDITCTVISEEGCKKSLTIKEMITVFPIPVASFLAHPQVTTILEPFIQFENTSSTLYYSLWQFGDGNSTNITHPQHGYDQLGTYSVKLYIESEHHCPDSTEMEVIIQDIYTFYAPDAFTPDHDEMNKLFSPIGVGIDKNLWDLRIYDRWGELVFQTNIYDVDENGRVNYGWDGRIKGKDIGENVVYVWLCVYRDLSGKEHTRSGTVTLMR